MNYRQWKKNYKKKNGVNPPIELDKRKQKKLVTKAKRVMGRIDFSEMINNMMAAIGSFFKVAGQVLTDVGEYIRNTSI